MEGFKPSRVWTSRPRPEEILAIIGPNGSGKTTLFNCISGVYKPNGGTILFEGESLLRLSPDAVARKGIARTFQNLRLFMHMTVLDNLLLGRHTMFKKTRFMPFSGFGKKNCATGKWSRS